MVMMGNPVRNLLSTFQSPLDGQGRKERGKLLEVKMRAKSRDQSGQAGSWWLAVAGIYHQPSPFPLSLSLSLSLLSLSVSVFFFFFFICLSSLSLSPTKALTSHLEPQPSFQASVCDPSNGFKLKNQPSKLSNKLYNGACSRNNMQESGMSSKEIAVIQIQTAFRGYQARKISRQLKGTQKLRFLSGGGYVNRQTSITLHFAKSWSKMQTAIRARRVSMAAEGRIKQKKQENQVKLEAKLHDLEVEWCGGVETMEGILSRIYRREEAAVKRERAMAYAFSHQWRANPGVNQGQPYEIGKENWGWSWMERWITARPWEVRISSLQKIQSKSAIKTIKKGNLPIKSAQSAIKPPIYVTRIPAKSSSQSTDQKAVNQEQNPAMVTTQICEVL